MPLELDSLRRAVTALQAVVDKSDDAEFMRSLDDVARNAIRAGVTDTPALRKIPEAQQMIDLTMRRNPTGRMTTPQDVANAIVALSGPLAGFINGAFITWGDVPPFVATLGMLAVARGLAFTLTDGRSIDVTLPDWFRFWFGTGYFGPIPAPVTEPAWTEVLIPCNTSFRPRTTTRSLTSIATSMVVSSRKSSSDELNAR